MVKAKFENDNIVINVYGENEETKINLLSMGDGGEPRINVFSEGDYSVRVYKPGFGINIIDSTISIDEDVVAQKSDIPSWNYDSETETLIIG